MFFQELCDKPHPQQIEDVGLLNVSVRSDYATERTNGKSWVRFSTEKDILINTASTPYLGSTQISILWHKAVVSFLGDLPLGCETAPSSSSSIEVTNAWSYTSPSSSPHQTRLPFCCNLVPFRLYRQFCGPKWAETKGTFGLALSCADAQQHLAARWSHCRRPLQHRHTAIILRTKTGQIKKKKNRAHDFLHRCQIVTPPWGCSGTQLHVLVCCHLTTLTTGRWTLHNEELYDLSQNIFLVIKSRRIKWLGHVWGENEMHTGFWCGNHLHVLGIDGRIILKKIIMISGQMCELNSYGCEWGQATGWCEHGNEPSGSILFVEFLH
jgi:hypothetical protein